MFSHLRDNSQPISSLGTDPDFSNTVRGRDSTENWMHQAQQWTSKSESCLLSNEKKIKINTLLYQWSFPTHNILSLRPNSRPIMFETSRSACGDKIGCKRINYVIFCCRIFISYLNFATRIHALLLTIFGLHSNYAHSQRVTGLQNPIPCTTVTNEWWLLFFFPFCFNIYRLCVSLICSCLCKLNRFIDKKHMIFDTMGSRIARG